MEREPDVNDELLTPSEAALYLRTTRNTVYRWLRAGSLPALKVGGAWRIRKGALDARGTTAAARPVSPAPVEWSEVLDHIEQGESGHWLVITATPDEVSDVDASFLNRGLDAGARVIKGSWWQDSDDMRRELAGRGIDVEALERSGALVIMDVAAIYARSGVGGVVDEWTKLLEATPGLGFRGLWKSGSPVLDDRVPFEGVVRVEEAASRFFERPGVYAICPTFSLSDHPQWHGRLMQLLDNHGVVVYRSAQRAVLLRPAS
jgi:excisionase family DNA binding protein